MNGMNGNKVLCKMLISDDKKHLSFQISNRDGSTVQRTFIDFERLYDNVKTILPQTLDKPPKKKLLLAEAKLAEKRKIWVENFSTYLIGRHADNYEVQSFFGPLISNGDEDGVNLGPSERKSMRPDDFDFVKTIGKGTFGRVFLVRHRATRQVYAMKVLGKEHIKMRNEVKHVMAERNVLKSNINHPFLVSLHYSFQTKDKLYFVLDFLNGGELFTHLQREKNFTEPRARFYAAEIASALGYLHQNNIIYRDLKPENLLLDRYGHVVLTDFGLCKEGIKLKDKTDTFCGTPEYLAPEVILKKPYDRTVDWWCLGSVLYEMLFGLPPFYSKNQNEMYERIVHQPLVISSMASAASRDILSQLLQKNSAERLGSRLDFEEIRDHAFFLSINWEKLLRREIKPQYVPKLKNDIDDTYISDEFKRQPINPGSLVPGPNNALNVDKDFVGFTFVQPSALEVK